MKSKKRVVFLAIAAVCAATVLALLVGDRTSPSATYARFIEQVRAGQVESVTVAAGKTGPVEAAFRLKDGTTSLAFLPDVATGTRRVAENSTPFLLLVVCWLALLIALKRRNGPRNLTPASPAGH